MKILHDLFGLEVFIMHKNLDELTKGYLTYLELYRHERYGWFIPKQVITCCLVLPNGCTGEPVTIDASVKSRFHRAMGILGLGPYVHPSQLEDLTTVPLVEWLRTGYEKTEAQIEGKCLHSASKTLRRLSNKRSRAAARLMAYIASAVSKQPCAPRGE